jgi:ribonuclease Y
MDVLATKERKIEVAETQLAERDKLIAEKTAKADELLAQQRAELLRIARLSPDQARALCLRQVEQEVEKEAGEIVERILTTAEDNAREKARYITISAIQRYAAEHTCETTVASIDVASDDMKGRIIGREGRNIRAFEKVTGATVIVDDTPGIVSVSCFDPVRKEVARVALDRLIRDGRIHPTRIEEIVAEVTKEVDQRILEAGKQAAADARVAGLNKKVIEVLGRLQFRTSYGQNVLRHSVEVAFLCGMMADELGLDGALARRCALLHDIGKALDHEYEGAHTKTGYEFVRRFNEPPAVLNAIQGHHGDVAATHPYTPLVAAADAISASRPGGRRESLERYIKRLQDLERIATSFEGVNVAYAIEAGREVRVIVDAERVDDRCALKLARDIAKKIEEEMGTFPGEIKVAVLREVRAIEYAISGRFRGNGAE